MTKIEDEVKTQFNDAYAKVWINILFTSSWANALQVDLFKPYNLSPQQFNIMRILKGFGDWMKIHDIKSRMLDKSPNMTRLVDKLIEKEHIERRRCDQDRRVIYARITDSGSKLLDEIDKVLVPHFANSPLRSIATEEEAEVVSNFLDKLRDTHFLP